MKEQLYIMKAVTTGGRSLFARVENRVLTWAPLESMATPVTMTECELQRKTWPDTTYELIEYVGKVEPRQTLPIDFGEDD